MLQEKDGRAEKRQRTEKIISYNNASSSTNPSIGRAVGPNFDLQASRLLHLESGEYIGTTNYFMERHGSGRMCWDVSHPINGGAVYQGEWKDNMRHGKGAFYTTVGNTRVVCDGMWENDKRHGHFRVQEAEFVMDAQFCEDQIVGPVFIRYPNGDHYHGAWVDEKKEGRGTLYSEAGRSTYDD